MRSTVIFSSVISSSCGELYCKDFVGLSEVHEDSSTSFSIVMKLMIELEFLRRTLA